MVEQQVQQDSPVRWHPESFIDRSGVMRLVDHNVALLRKIVGGFLETSPELLDEIEQAIENGDGRTLSWKAQVLKDAAKVFHCQASCEAATELVDLGGQNDLTQASAALERLKTSLLKLQCSLRIYAGEFPA